MVMFYTSAVECKYKTRHKCKLQIQNATGEISINNMLHSLFNIKSLDSSTYFFVHITSHFDELPFVYFNHM